MLHQLRCGWTVIEPIRTLGELASSLITDPNMNLPVKSKRVPDWGYGWLLLLQHAPQKNSKQGNDHHKQEREPSLLLADFSPHQFLQAMTSKNCCFRKICIVLGFYLPTPSILKVTRYTIPTVWNIGGKWQCGFPKCWMSKFPYAHKFSRKNISDDTNIWW